MASALRPAPILLWLIVIFSACPENLSLAQEAAVPAPRPRIGLALSGGGALGLTEIGVIRWLDENHVPIDAVAGTSMGSIIGAMYATGMSADEIEQFAKKIDWDQAFLNGTGYLDLSFRRKQDRRNFQVATPLGLKHGLNGPNGFDSGQSVELLLDRIALPEYGIASFDDLPIPFRCVATDMLNGEAVVLHDGPLALALRASMAIPGVFTPVDINGHVLADGGLVENIPVETVRAMHTDVVIAVQLRTPPSTRAKLESITGMLSRSVDIMITQNEARSLSLAQAKISIDTSGFGVFDFSRMDDMIALGYRAAASQSADLLRYALNDPQQWQEYVASREKRKRMQPQKVTRIEVTGADSDTNHRIEHRLAKALLHGDVDLSQLDTQLTRIDGEGQFDRLGYEGFTQNNGPELKITAHEKTYGPPFVDLAVNVDGSGVAAFDFSAGARVTFMDFGHHGAEWRNDFLFGSSDLGATEFFQPLFGSHFFLAPYAFASKFARNSFNGSARVAVFGEEQAGGGIDFGHDTRRSEFRLGYENFDGKLSPLIGGSGLPRVSGSTGEFRARFVWDGQDNPAVPSTGTRFVATAMRVLQSPDLAHPVGQIEVRNSTFIPLSSKTSLFVLADGGTTFGGSAGPFQVFSLGGQFRLGAYLPDEFLGNHYVYSSLGFRREFLRLPQLVGRNVYWGGWYEAGSAFGTAQRNPGPFVVRGTVNVGILADTIVGPIALAGSVSPTGQSRINFSVGRLF